MIHILHTKWSFYCGTIDTAHNNTVHQINRLPNKNQIKWQATETEKEFQGIRLKYYLHSENTNYVPPPLNYFQLNIIWTKDNQVTYITVHTILTLVVVFLSFKHFKDREKVFCKYNIEYMFGVLVLVICNFNFYMYKIT